MIVVSLHACGAASDMAMNLAFQCNNAPFVICPCCTAKLLTRRVVDDKNANVANVDHSLGLDPSASFQRSEATSDIEYPRSNWLRNKLSTTTNNDDNNDTSNNTDDKYTLLAKVADVGLGPQTPS